MALRLLSAALMMVLLALASATAQANPTLEVREKTRISPNPAFPDQEASATMWAIFREDVAGEELLPPAGTTLEWSVTEIKKDDVIVPGATASFAEPPAPNTGIEFRLLKASFNAPGLYKIKVHVKATNAALWEPDEIEAEGVVELRVSKARLKSATFSGAGLQTIKRDLDSSDYSAPHWLDLNGNGIALVNEGENRWPVGYVSGNTMQIQVELEINDANDFAGARQIRGTADDGYDFAATDATLAGNTLSATLTCAKVFPAAVVDKHTFNIPWQVTGDGGTTWLDVGTQNNIVYVLHGTPGATLFETVVDIGCRNAHGQSDEARIVEKIWGEFSDRTVARVVPAGASTAPVAMTYWGGGVASATDTAGLLRDGNGQCGSWASFFRDCLLAQSITAAKVTIVSTWSNDPALVTRPEDRTGAFLVKDWRFNGAGSLPAEVAPFTHQMSELTDMNGVAGQGNNNPPAHFLVHFIVKHDGKYYDPSYGTGTFNGASDDVAQADWEDRSLDGFTSYQILLDAAGHPVGMIEIVKRNSLGAGANKETAFSG